MTVLLDVDTGHVLAAGQAPDYLRHPANFGRVVTLIPLATFTAPATPAGTDGPASPLTARGGPPPSPPRKQRPPPRRAAATRRVTQWH